MFCHVYNFATITGQNQAPFLGSRKQECTSRTFTFDDISVKIGILHIFIECIIRVLQSQENITSW